MRGILPTPPPHTRSHLLPAAAALVTALAAWLSQGTFTYTSEAQARIGLVPLSVPALMIAVAAGAAAWWVVRRGLSAAPLLLLGLVLLPWLPGPVPAAFLLFSGPLALLVWAWFAAAFASGAPWQIAWFRAPGAWTAGLLALLIGAVAWWQVRTQVPGADEPHYLVITQSLLSDFDLKIENNHENRDYAAYFAGQLAADYRVRGRDGQIYSIHAPGVSAVVAPAFALAGYTGVGIFLLVISAAGSALAWQLAWIVSGRRDAAWFGWAAVTASSTWIFHAFAVYPDGIGGVLVLTGVWALIRADREVDNQRQSIGPWFWHGVALAVLPWLHTRFAVLAGGIGALVLLRMARVRNAPAKAFAFLSVPAVSFIAWLGYFIAIYGSPDPSAPYGREEGSFAFVPDGLAGLLFDQRFGLLAYAPVLLFALAGIGIMVARRPWRRYGFELLFVVVPYLLVVTYVAMWWGGRSAPARFFVPVLLWMAIPAAAAWAASTHRTTRVTAVGALVVTAFASAVLTLAGDGQLAFNTRETYAYWLEWLNGSVNLARALPVWWRDDELPLFRGMAVWLTAALAGWAILRSLEQQPWLVHPARLATAAGLVYALAAMGAAAVTWAAEDVPGRLTTQSRLEALRRLSAERRLLAVSLSPPGRLDRRELAGRLTLAPAFSTTPGGAGRNDRPLFSIPALPAGEYRIRPLVRAVTGWVMIGIGRDQFAIRTLPLDTAQDSFIVTLPIDVRALIVRGDEDARRNVTGLQVDPLRVILPEERIANGRARQGVRYGATTTWFLDDRSFPEPEGFWVGGARSTEVVIQPDTPHPAEVLFVRNGPADNTVLIETRRWREEMRLGPGEERSIQVPADQARNATWLRITTSNGFTPSAADPKSRDRRYLAMWVRVGG